MPHKEFCWKFPKKNQDDCTHGAVVLLNAEIKSQNAEIKSADGARFNGTPRLAPFLELSSVIVPGDDREFTAGARGRSEYEILAVIIVIEGRPGGGGDDGRGRIDIEVLIIAKFGTDFPGARFHPIGHVDGNACPASVVVVRNLIHGTQVGPALGGPGDFGY